jgi:hypothetical protein
MTAPSSRLVRLFGTDIPPTEVQRLSAGDLQAELVQGNLRAIRFKGHEILRAISYVVRDRDWGTFDPAISDLVVDIQPKYFEVRYSAKCGGRLGYTATIRGHADGTLKFSVTAMPDQDFETNRCGFCVLHPIVGVAGKSVTVEHCDGTTEDATFPDLIAPWQPFKSIRSLSHSPAEGIDATCRLLGDEFEMEDQRNWSDASYKTYVRPLALPWPYIMPAGTANTQEVELTLRVAPSVATGRRNGNTVRVTVFGKPTGRRLAETGLLVMPDTLQRTLDGAVAVKEIGPGFLLCHLDPSAGHGEAELAGYAQLHNKTNCPILLEYVALAGTDLDCEFRKLATEIGRSGLQIEGMIVCPSVDRQSTPPGSRWPECPPLSALYDAARENFPGLAIGGGMVSYFTELNRKRPPAERLDFVTHGTNPIVHAADDESVMQTLEALPFIFRSAREIMGDAQTYRLGPSFIPMRQNPYGSRAFENDLGERKAMAKADPRQRGVFAASFIAGYAARVAEHNIASFVPAGLFGPAGLSGGADTPYPALQVVKWLCSLGGQSVIDSNSEDEASILLAACKDDAGCVSVLISNITGRVQTAILDLSTRPSRLSVTVLDENSFGGAAARELPPGEDLIELPLKPYAVALLRYNV